MRVFHFAESKTHLLAWRDKLLQKIRVNGTRHSRTFDKAMGRWFWNLESKWSINLNEKFKWKQNLTISLPHTLLGLRWTVSTTLLSFMKLADSLGLPKRFLLPIVVLNSYVSFKLISNVNDVCNCNWCISFLQSLVWMPSFSSGGLIC